MNDRDIVDAFVAYLRDHGHPGLQVDRRPDEENRRSSDVDAMAGPFVIEHTSIDTLPNQRRDSAWFMQAVGGLEQELGGRLSYRVSIGLESNAVAKEQDRTAIRMALKAWIRNSVPGMADGRHIVDGVPWVPFRLHVTNASDRRPRIVFSRFEPEDDTLSDRIRAQFDRKAEKLSRYHGSGLTTLLLVENDDIALMNESKLLDAIRRAYTTAPPPGVDQIWYADTSIPTEIEFMDFTSRLWEGR